MLSYPDISSQFMTASLIHNISISALCEEIMINVIQFKDEYRITFPYDYRIKELVKSIPGRRWDPDSKSWYIPSKNLGILIRVFENSEFRDMVTIKSNEGINVNKALESTSSGDIPDLDLSNVKTYVKDGYHLYSHQLDFLKYAIDRQNSGNTSGFLVCDEMGCVSGDIIVQVNIRKASSKKTIRELYQHWVSYPEYHAIGNYKVRCLKDGKFGLNDVLDVVYSGIKPVYELTLDNGYKIKLTKDHKVLTSEGFRSTDSLHAGDTVVLNGQLVPKEAKVSSIEYIGLEDVYDLKMNHPYHNFVGNGVIVHNCGKTIEALNLALYNKLYYKFSHCLIICCVNTSKYNWLDEVSDHTNGQYEGYILGSRKTRKGTVNYNGSSKNKLEDLQSGFKYNSEKEGPLPYFLILNVEAIRMKDGRLHPIADEIIGLINDGKINMIVIDEVHKNLSPQSQQGKQILRIKKLTKSKCMWIPMTGTPIVNKPTDLFVPLRLIDAHTVDSYWSWNQKFCVYGGFGGHDIIGYKNIDLLKNILQGNMIRRLKDDILDLPDKIELLEYVENTPYQDRLMKEITADLLRNKDDIITSLNPLAKMMKLRQVNGSPELIDTDIEIDSQYIKKNAKLKRLLELIDEILDRGEKVVVFSNWVEPLRTIREFLKKKHLVCCFTGTMNESDRQQHKNAFINNPECKILIGTIGALGTTHTLTVANNIIFYDEPWTAADRQQAIDRCHRISTTKSVNVYTLLSKNTIDERVHSILYGKKMISNYIVDNQLDIYNNPELFDILLGR